MNRTKPHAAGRSRTAVSSLWPAGWLLALAVMAAGPTAAACDPASRGKDALTVTPGTVATVTVCTAAVVREALPSTLFGFNIHHYHFERDIFNAGAVPESVTAALQPLGRGLYRYPGGLVANNFSWEDAVGPIADRAPQKSVKWDAAAPVRFGVDEYLSFVDAVGGQPWYVLNLAGWDDVERFPELDAAAVAASNGRLASYMKARLAPLTPRYYQLGNELDRADYQWAHEKYVARARLSIDAIRAVDPDANFVAFLREFDWNYRGAEKARGVSRYQDFIRDVLTGLPDVNDFSMHFYYDARNTTEVYRRLPWRLRQFRLAIDEAKKYRRGEDLNVWITEHARGIDFGKMKAREARPYTSNLAAAVSTGDFLIALAQIPEIQGASWHGLNAMPWQVFDPQRKLAPNPVYWGMRVLREMKLPRVLGTWTTSPNNSGYAGGYDVRAVAFGNADDTALGLWATNRAAQPTQVVLRAEEWGGRAVTLRHYTLAGATDVDPDSGQQPVVELEPEAEMRAFDASGVLVLTLPPASVSTVVLTAGPAP